MSWIIFAGRFQPFHIGHLSVLQQVVTNFSHPDVLILSTITPYKSSMESVDTWFAQHAEEHQLPERNPWSVPVRLMALTAVVKEVQNINPSLAIITTAIPRPDYGWNLICSWFPGERIWVIPNAGEDFDENKIKFFYDRGDKTIRYKDETNVSGRELRDYWLQNKLEKMKMFMPECVHSAYLGHISEK